MKKKITYAQVGDNYDTKDPIKKLAQLAARQTVIKEKSGFKEISDSRGESAFVWQQNGILMASVVEGLGTKNLVADEMRKIVDPERSRKTYYDVIGHDTVATIINDLITVGAKPRVVHAYWAIEDNSWLEDKQRMTDFVNGWRDACRLSMATWGGGETPTLKGVIEKNTVDLGGSAIGVIANKNQLITDKKLKIGDRILLLKSNGINCNGLSLARAVAKKFKKGYATKLRSNKMYGEALLTKTNIYAKLIQDLLKSGIDIHYISNITGHGLRKIMRARQKYSYIIEKIFEPQEVFLFIQKHANLDDYEMYQTFNMGQDYAIFLPEKDVEKAQKIIRRTGFVSINAGFVEKGERQVIIKPKNLVYKGDTLDLR
ncbi:phosphoribosylformylglycinamidine cyclo-ligase [Candidatus Microgenomates bacterium]|nr:phosphoribosylformylglycinamidine cyclo-ligase [Candidatus Microgenomates bacterium]